MEIGVRLRKCREAKRLSQSEVAFLIGVSQSTYFTWESGEQVNIRMKYIPKIVEVLGVDINELIPESASLKIETRPIKETTIDDSINFTNSTKMLIDEISSIYRRTISLLEDKVAFQNTLIHQLEVELNTFRQT